MKFILGTNQIDDVQVRDNFKQLELELNANPAVNGQWKLFDRTFASTGTYTIYHRLNFKPLDVIETHKEATVSYDLTNATDSSIELNVTVVGRVRFLLGRIT